MRKKKYRLVRAIMMILMMMCVFWMGGERCLAQTKGQILCTNNNTDYPNATVLDTSNKDFFPAKYTVVKNGESYTHNPFELHITEDTMLVINGAITVEKNTCREANDTKTTVNAGAAINYLEGIILDYNVTLTIRLENRDNFYIYGKKEPYNNTLGGSWVYHAGIEVPPSSTLIIEQTKNVNGKLIAVGAGSRFKGDHARGTGAGIGGRGWDFDNKTVSGYENYSDCGTVIIRSGTICACGGIGIDYDARGTGAGIGGGGIWRNTGSDEATGKISSAQCGIIKIYGGWVEAYGGGTLNTGGNKNIYDKNKDLFFNSGKGFYVTDVSSGCDYAYGTGAGIGGGGLAVAGNLGTTTMRNRLDLEYYAGKVDAFAGRGTNIVKDGEYVTRGVGAGIGGGGGYADHKHAGKSKRNSNATLTIKVANYYDKSDSDTISDTTQNHIIAHYYKEAKGTTYGLENCRFATLGGWYGKYKQNIFTSEEDCTNYNDKNGTEIPVTPIEGTYEMMDYGTNVKPVFTGKFSIYNYPKEAYSDIVAPPKIEIDDSSNIVSYAVDKFEGSVNTDFGDKLEGEGFKNSLKEAIDAASIASNNTVVTKIIVSDNDKGYVENFKYTMGHGIKEIRIGTEGGPGTATIGDMYESYNTKKMKKITPYMYIKVTEGDCFDSRYRGQNDATNNIFTFYASKVEVYVITKKSFYIKVTDIVDKNKQTNISLNMPSYDEELSMTVAYTIYTTDGNIYSGDTEQKVFQGLEVGKTVKSEQISVLVTSSLSTSTTNMIEKIEIRSPKIQAQDTSTGGDAYTVVGEASNSNKLDCLISANGTYLVYVKSVLGTEEEENIEIKKVNETRQQGDSGFPIPNVKESVNELKFSKGDKTEKYLIPEKPSEPSAPADAEQAGPVGSVDNVSVDVSINIDKITGGDATVSKFSDLDSVLDKINWNKKQKVDWDKQEEKIREIPLQYKKELEKGLKELPLYQDSQIRSPLDTDDTIYTNGNSKSYVVKYYTQNRLEGGNGYTTLGNYSGTTYSDSISKKMSSTNVKDIAYEGEKAISISCEHSGGVVKAKLEPAVLVVGSSVKEVGVRVEYELNGITTGLVHKWNYVEGQNGEFGHEFKNIPKNNVKYSAYYINNENEEFSTIPA